MTEKVLTDDEKSALLDGVQSGEVEVQTSNGAEYASVSDFRIPQRAHIVKNSFPRLTILNQQVAERLRRDAEQLLQSDVGVSTGDLSVVSFGRVCERLHGLSAVAVFEAAPLMGRALIAMEAPLVRLLVDTFFGGLGTGGSTEERASFTPGEISVANLFTTIVLSSIKETWAPLQDIQADRVSTEVSIDLVDIGAETDPVILTEFEVTLSDQNCIFFVVWPVEMVQPLLPVFDGQKGDRDPVEDARWEKVIRRRLADSVVNLTSKVGYAQMTLGQLVDLNPGDVIQIDSPQEATVMAKDVNLIHGRLGIHRGRNAVETIGWIDPETAGLASTGI
jgi:flagellar motor switch protein FliM